jgi:hypothetical protein
MAGEELSGKRSLSSVELEALSLMPEYLKMVISDKELYVDWEEVIPDDKTKKYWHNIVSKLGDEIPQEAFNDMTVAGELLYERLGARRKALKGDTLLDMLLHGGLRFANSFLNDNEAVALGDIDEDEL